jgi:hypothetical protein
VPAQFGEMPAQLRIDTAAGGVIISRRTWEEYLKTQPDREALEKSAVPLEVSGVGGDMPGQQVSVGLLQGGWFVCATKSSGRGGLVCGTKSLGCLAL